MSSPIRVEIFTPAGTHSLHLHKDGNWEFKFKEIDHLEIDVATGTVSEDQCLIQQHRARPGTPLEDMKLMARILQALTGLNHGG